jgi:hypothetical protein
MDGQQLLRYLTVRVWAALGIVLLAALMQSCAAGGSGTAQPPIIIAGVCKAIAFQDVAPTAELIATKDPSHSI